MSEMPHMFIRATHTYTQRDDRVCIKTNDIDDASIDKQKTTEYRGTNRHKEIMLYIVAFPQVFFWFYTVHK